MAPPSSGFCHVGAEASKQRIDSTVMEARTVAMLTACSSATAGFRDARLSRAEPGFYCCRWWRRACWPNRPRAPSTSLPRHEVTAQFATSDGKPMADAAVRVFSPGDPKTPVETGHTDSQGKFVFGADRDGMWTAEARTSAEVARVMIRVGAGAPQEQQRSRLPPIAVIGAIILLVAMGWWYLLLRRRGRVAETLRAGRKRP